MWHRRPHGAGEVLRRVRCSLFNQAQSQVAALLGGACPSPTESRAQACARRCERAGRDSRYSADGACGSGLQTLRSWSYDGTCAFALVAKSWSDRGELRSSPR